MSRNTRAGTLCRLALAVHAAFAVPAIAADSEQPVDTGKLDVVVITGEKNQRTEATTASSVAVTTAIRMEQENLLSLTDILQRTPNVNTTYGPRDYSIRGIMNASGDPNPLSTIYLDGAALPPAATDTLPGELWDIAQVEIFRGPQSTIQGQNALAGAIVLRTQDPTMYWDARARLIISDPHDRRAAFAGGGPLINDELAFRIAVEDRDFHGYTWNPTRHVGEDAVDSRTIRAKLLWKPKAINGLTVRLSANHDDRDGPYMFSYTRIDTPNPYKDRVMLSNDPSTTVGKTDVVNLEADYMLAKNWSLSAVGSWTKADLMRSYDQDFSPARLQFGTQHEKNDGKSTELRLHYNGDKLRGLVGLYGSDRDRSVVSASNTNVETPVDTIAGVLMGSGFPAANASALAAMYAKALPSIPVDYGSNAPASNRNRALFADGEYQFSERWTALGGFRYDRETYAFQSDTTALFAGTLPNPASFDPSNGLIYQAVTGINQAVLGLVSQANGHTPFKENTFTAFLPKVGLRWNWNADESLAFTTQRGYRSGGSSYNVARALVVPFEPEFTQNYELALRTRSQDGQWRLNANTYYIDWKDKQVQAFFGQNNFDYHTVNAGKAHLYGGELELRHRPNRSFDWYASLGLSRTCYDEFTSVAGGNVKDYAGYEFAYAPRSTAAIGANYRWGNGWLANANANYQSSVAMDVGSGTKRLPGRALANAKIGYETAHWSAHLFASNLFDRGYTQYHYLDNPYAILGAPRVVGINLNWFM